MSQQGIVSFHFLFTKIEPSFVNASFVLTEKQVNQPCWLSTHDGENHQLRSSTWFPIRKLRTCDTQRCEKSTMMCMETSACMCVYIYMCVHGYPRMHTNTYITCIYVIYIYVHRTKKWYVFPLWIPNTDPARCCKTRPSWAKVATENFYSIPKSKKISPLQVATASPFHVWSWFFPESVWAQGSSNSGGLYLIFSSSHLLLIFTSSSLSSHLLIFTSVSHLLIFTSVHLHICSSSHLLIFTSAHLHTFFHIFSSSHLLIFTSSLTSAHLHICSSSHLLSHLLIFTSAHLHTFSRICSSSHLLIFTSSLTSLSFFSLSPSFYLSLLRPRVVPAGSHETSTLSHEMMVDRQKLR